MSDAHTLSVDGLRVAFDGRRVVDDLSFTLRPGRILALVGESGSGKSVTARSLVGLAGAGAVVQARSLLLGGRDLLGLDERQWRTVRGHRIGFVLQDALVSLDPLRPVGREVEEALSVAPAYRGFAARHARRAKVAALLAASGLAEPELRARQRPDELSGGQRQRALIATAIALDPPVLIADEPTTALDATAAARILDLFAALRDQGRAILLISHDLHAVARIADEVIVLQAGIAVERGPPARVLHTPRHSYARALVAAQPGRAPPRPAAPATAPVVLAAHGLAKTYRGPGGTTRRVLEGLDIVLRRGQTLGILGESGSGKTTAARICAGFIAPDAGDVRFLGTDWTGPGDPVGEAVRRRLRPLMGIVYQDPLSSFDPRWTVGRILDDALAAIGTPRAARRTRAGELLDLVRLPQDIAARPPQRLSGGQRQRVAIARALATEPRVLICDEPVSALDVSVQAQILALLAELQARLDLSCLFISHDLAVIRDISDEVMVMRDGRVVETGPARSVLRHPQSAFTRQLVELSA